MDRSYGFDGLTWLEHPQSQGPGETIIFIAGEDELSALKCIECRGSHNELHSVNIRRAECIATFLLQGLPDFTSTDTNTVNFAYSIQDANPPTRNTAQALQFQAFYCAHCSRLGSEIRRKQMPSRTKMKYSKSNKATFLTVENLSKCTESKKASPVRVAPSPAPACKEVLSINIKTSSSGL